jgi:hypothetical protein
MMNDEVTAEVELLRQELGRLTDEVKKMRLLAQAIAWKFGIKVQR